MARILVVDDEHKIRRQIAAYLGDDHDVSQAATVAEGRQRLDVAHYNLLISDVRLPDGTGLELLKHARSAQPNLAVVLITAYGSVEDAVEAMRVGAFDYILKPFKLEGLGLTCKHALSNATIKAEHAYMLDERREVAAEIIGSSQAISQVRKLIAVAAPQPTTVLVTGESGTGKELVAEALHRESGKAYRPLVRINCPAIPKDLFESELFGHLKGSFTGALESRRGKFELADGGTLFLDEVSEIPIELQSKLLRILESRTFTRVGSNQEIHLDLRIVAASNRNLEASVKTGAFRQDLYYRLKIFPIHVPPLRDRREDIPELAAHLLDKIVTQLHLVSKGITSSALDQLRRYSWPGNVREFRNVLERGLLLTQGEPLGQEHLPAELLTDKCIGCKKPESPCINDLNKQVEAFRQKRILEALTNCMWIKKDAAERLGLSPRALSHYIKKYNIDQHRQG
ncbi:MAG: sigma-54-dependent Fis family transcriptional regulator [Deltaproteobacteria bacterium]|nr:sigma-54-dependent Fis family transcriptional regulator [Deltaproteobacteria bacterium]